MGESKLSSMNCDAASQRRIHTSAIRHCGPVFPLFVVLLVMPIGKTVFVSQGRSNLMCQDPAHCFEQMEARLSVGKCSENMIIACCIHGVLMKGLGDHQKLH